MIYVYVKNNRIYAKSDKKKRYPGCVMIQSDFGKTEELIFEDNQIKLYKESKQYRKDKHIETIEEENTKLRSQNNELIRIADREIRGKLRKKEGEQLTDFDRQKYFSLYGK